MANFLFRFRDAVAAIGGFFAQPPSRRDALVILEDMEKYRNLHSSVAVVSFFVSAGFGVLAFFLITESALWAGVAKPVALLIVAVSWVLIFPIWALIFLFIMSGLGAMGIRDVGSAVRYSLSNLTLSQDRLHELHRILASRNWRHGRIFKSVIADLTEEKLQS
jgi:hypothetical protein